MSVKEKAIAYVGRTLNKLGEKERTSCKSTVCPVIGFQPQRPERTPDRREAK